ncbi:alpha/beta hydrolase [Arthrobacter sp. H5]|uniref:alpha/beta fold hydrolase n=1 Tax=Arthrobacter sp. H5 TaxID=1267973 RepID=UPI0004B78793|nr:alpha/beta hydrolase [Arthrobacter sp. H5]
MTTSYFPVVHPPTIGSVSPGSVIFLHGGNVANWMWQPQVEALRDYHVFTPDLPAFGNRTSEPWVSLDHAADDVASLIRADVAEGPIHVVGLSLGAMVALRLAARHPELASSILVSGAAVTPVGGLTKALARLQLALWDRAWFWRLQARAFRLPADSHQLYIDHGLSVERESARRMLADVYDDGLPDGIGRYSGRLMALAGSREPRPVRNSLSVIVSAVAQSVAATVPGMHHIWNIEDADLFNEVVRQWISGSVHPDLELISRPDGV